MVLDLRGNAEWGKEGWMCGDKEKKDINRGIQAVSAWRGRHTGQKIISRKGVAGKETRRLGEKDISINTGQL